jgi:hypothetical protein
MFIARENRGFFLFSWEYIAFFQGFRIFTFFLSFKAAKALYVWRIIPGSDSIYRYLRGWKEEKKWKKKFLHQSLITHVQQVQFECSRICHLLIPLLYTLIISSADQRLWPWVRQRVGKRGGSDSEGDQERKGKDTQIETEGQKETEA